MVSRFHCALTIRGEEVCIRDLGSTNGTIVDGERLTDEFTLSDGDIFQVGPLAFQVVIRHGATTATQPATPTAMPVAAAGQQGVSGAPAQADDVVQWLISDSKNEIPASGSGVYDGKTAFNLSTPQDKSTQDSESAHAPPGDAPPAARAASAEDRTEPKPGDKKQTPAKSSGAAAHAAEDAIRRFLERRAHK
jgi:predicted component of type VI protein secretion system